MVNNQLVPVAEIDDEGGLELGKIFAALRRRVLLIAGITTVVASGAVLKAITDTPVYESGFEILTEPVTVETRIISSLNPEALGNQEDLITASVDEAKLKILKSPRVLEPVVENLNSRYPDITYGTLYKNLSVKPSSEDILVVTYRDLDPGVVQDVLDEVSSAYIEFSLQDRQSNIQRGIAFVDEQLPQLRSRVDSLQAELEVLRQDNNLIDPLVQGEQISSQISALQQERTSLNVQLDEAQQLYTNLQQELERNGAFAAATLLIEDPRYSELLNQVLGIDSQIAEQSALLLEGSPEIQTLQAQRQNLVPLIQREGQRIQQLQESHIRELSFRKQAVDDAIESLNNEIKQLSSVARKYSDIQRELEIATTNLNEFLTQRESLRIEVAQSQAPWELLTQAGKPRASVASAKRNLVLGTALGLILGVGVALAIDKFSSLVRSPKEIKEITRLPLLGVIPLNQLLKNDIASSDIMSSDNIDHWLREALPTLDTVDTQDIPYVSFPFIESFRSLYTNVRLSNPDKPIGSLAISSATSNEGKSTVSINLAKAAAAMNRKVLIIDADLRRPSIHKYLELDNRKGLVDAVSLNLPLSDVVQPSHESKNLFVLTAGAIPPDPTTALASSIMQQLHEQAQQEYDLVIYDTAPLMGLADTYLVANFTQGLLLVVGLDKVKRGNLEQAVNDLKVARTPVLGTVANMASDQSPTSYSYYEYLQDQNAASSHISGFSISRMSHNVSRSLSNLLSSQKNKNQ